MALCPKLIIVLPALVLGSCAALEVPELVMEQAPPSHFLEFRSHTSACPIFSGVFRVVPEVATLAEDGSWAISKGSEFDYALVIPLDQSKIPVTNSASSEPEISRDEIEIDSRIPYVHVRFTLFSKKRDRIETFLLDSESGAYTCDGGNLVFPQFVISGGGEGYTLNGRIFRRASVSRKGDFYVYEQARGYKTRHRYFLFKKQRERRSKTSSD
jgi:hypothetical protein